MLFGVELFQCEDAVPVQIYRELFALFSLLVLVVDALEAVEELSGLRKQ